MVDPATVGTVASLVIKTLGLVHKRREGKLEKTEAQELYSRIYCSLLWEIHQNMTRCAYIVNQRKEGKFSVGVLSFFVRDALFPDFCVMCPEPRVIADLNEIYSAFERIHHWQRVIYSAEAEGVRYVLGFAEDLFKKKLHEKYNVLVDSVSKLSDDLALPPKIDMPNDSSQADTTVKNKKGDVRK